MEFLLLGPVEVLDGSRPVALGGRQRRTLLAVLLVHAGDVVSTDRLIDELWGDGAPAASRKTVQAHVAHLRRLLNTEAEVLVGTGDGYVIQADPRSIDAIRFEQMVGDARQLRAHDPGSAAGLFEEALSLFRGAPLSGIADDAFSLRVEASRLEEMRLAAMEDLLETRLAAGASTDVAVEAERLVAQHPLRERLWGLLALAYYRTGRQGDALRALGRLRERLIEELGVEVSPEIRELEQRILEQDPTLTDLQRSAVEAPVSITAAPVVRNPYKGLRAFDESDAPDFFGREDLVRRLLERFTARQAHGLVVLVGPSGVGKSSVVRAGLVPALREGSIRDSVSWDIVVTFPGTDPFASLAKGISEVRGSESPVDLAQQLRNSSAEGAVATLARSGWPLVVVIDQFEELFTLTAAHDPDLIDPFLELLSTTASTAEGDVWVVATLRADFLGRAMAHQSFGPLLEDALMLVPPLSDHEVRAAIVEPAARVGVDAEPELVAEMSREVAARPGSLPLLQFSLADLFDRRRGQILTLDAYRAAGGITGALTRRAEELYTRLDPASQGAAQQLFLRLVTMTDGGHLVRQRVSRDSVAQLSAGDASVARLIEDLGRYRLITFDQDPDSGEAVIEVAHEALLTQWPRLHDWIEDAREGLRLRGALMAAARDWIAGDRDTSYLFRGARLAAFEEWASGTELALTSDERLFLAESRKQEDALRRRQATRRRIVVGVLSAAAAVATVLAVFAATQRDEAQRQAMRAEEEASRALDLADIAETNARLARARGLAAAAIASLDDDPQRSILLALESAEITRDAGEGVIREAQEALHRAILESRLELIITPENNEGIIEPAAAVFSPDNDMLAVGSADGIIRIYDPNTGAELSSLEGHDAEIIDVKWDSAGTRLLTVSFDGTARLWSVSTGEELQVFGPLGAPALIGSLSPDGGRVAISTVGRVLVWEVGSGSELLSIDLPPPLGPVGVAFDPVAGDLLAVAVEGPGELGAGVIIFDSHSGEEQLRIPADDGVCELRWSPEGSRLATASSDTTGRVWDVATGDLLASFEDHHSFLCTVDFSPDGTQVVTGGDDGTARIWDAATGRQLIVLAGHEERVAFVSFSPDGRRVVTSSEDDRIRIWNVSPEGRREVVTAFDPTVVVRARYSPDGTRFATSSFTGTAHLWDAVSGEEVASLVGHESWVYTIAFSDDGSRLVTGGRDFAARLWDATTLEELARFDAPAPVTAVAFSADDERIALGTIAGTVHLWDPITGTDNVLAGFEEGLGQVFATAFSPDGSLLAVGGDREIRFWDTSTHQGLEPILVSEEAFHSVHGLEFSADGRRLLTAHRDGTVRVWNVDSREQVHQFQGHRGLVWDATFSPDERIVASAGMDGTVRLWDTEDGQELLILRDRQSFTSVDFSPDGRLLLVAGDFGARIYVVEEEDLMALARSRLLRWWTPQECLQYLGTETCPPPPASLAG